MLHSLFLWFYRLPIHGIILLLLLATAVFRRLECRFRLQYRWRAALAAALVLWGSIVLWSTVWSRSDAQTVGLQLVPLHSYRAVLSGENRELLRSNFMNMVMFYPAGLLLRSLFPKVRRWLCLLLTLLSAFCFSAVIEYLQFSHALGLAEIDDVIHNTLGAVLGGLTASLETGIVPVPKGRNAQDRTC